MYTKILLALAVLAMAGTYTIVFVNAEPDFGEVESDCYQQFNTTVITNDGNYTRHQMFCFWEINEFTNAGAIQNLTSVEQTALDLMVEKRESGESDIEIDLSYLDETFTVPPIRDPDVVPESCTRNNPSPKDIEECNLDTKMSFCERGVQSTSAIQQYEYFNVSEYTPRDDLQIDLQDGGSIVGKLKAYEECRAELRLIIDLNKTHYVGIAKEIAKGEYNPYHADFVTSDFVYSAGETEATESEIVFQARKALDQFCSIEYIQESMKIEQGCDDKFLKKYEGTYKNNTGMTSYEKKLINSDPMVSYYKYMETEGVGYVPNWIKKHNFGITGINTSNDNTQWQFKATLED